MELYHGSNVSVKEPKIMESDRKLDFGSGFYLTSSLEQAERWSKRTAERRGNGKPTITVFDFDETQLADLKVLRFETANKKWLNFIAGNRDGLLSDDKWDIVIGLVANDRTMPVIRLFLAKVYTVSETLRRLLPQKLQDQYTFKTFQALNALTFKEVIHHE